MRTSVGTALLILLVTGTLWARTLHVPTPEFPTVQAGLDSLENGDTVLVSLGTYAESLHAPPLAFILRGDVIPDTGNYPRPVIDPSTLPHSDSIGCLTLARGATPVIEDMVFRNGAAMYSNRHAWNFGGARTNGPQVTFRRCIFDSTYYSIFLGNDCRIELRECRFLNVWNCVTSFNYCPVVDGSDCLFTGRSGGSQVSACGGCRLERCRFGCNDYGNQCLAGGNIEIRNCQFGPCAPSGPGNFYYDPPLFLRNSPRGVIEDNLFLGLRLGFNVVTVANVCRQDTSALSIRHNQFMNIVVETSSGYPYIQLSCEGGSSGVTRVRIDSNVFANNRGSDDPFCRGIAFVGAVGSATGNLFHNLTDNSGTALRPAVIHVWDARLPVLRSNHFDSTGVAVSTERASDTADARWNWWGDSTGPYHEISNPQGLGDTIIGRVDFTPWCVDTVNCEEPNATPDRNFILHPSSFVLSAFPNPFNSTTVIRLEVPQAEIVRVELFDILGRRVRELWAGAVADEKEIAFDGNELASGVYFVRATNTIWNRPLVSSKLVLLK